MAKIVQLGFPFLAYEKKIHTEKAEFFNRQKKTCYL